MGSKSFVVTRGEETLVRPAPSTGQYGTDGLYYLSNIDVTMKTNVVTLYCYKPVSAGAPADNTNTRTSGGSSVAAKLKEALEKVLVYYYPLIGRIVKGPNGRLAVDCSTNGDKHGALFIEAEADADVEDVGDLSEPDPMMLETLMGIKCLGQYVDEEAIIAIPSVVVQVTKFRCGGFVLGLSLSHILLDGVAAMDFLTSWAETARGLPLSNPPFLDRTILKPRSPLAVEFPHPELQPPPEVAEYHNSVNRSFVFTAEQLSELKSKLSADAVGEGDTTYTSVEALTGLVWRSWAVALGLGRRDTSTEEETCRVMFAVDARRRFNPPLPAGFMGNAVLITSADCPAVELVERHPSFAAGLVRNASRKVTDAYLRSGIDYLEATGSAGSLAHFATARTLFFAMWSRLEFHRHDFGWGEHAYVGQPMVSDGIVMMFPSTLGSPRGGKRGMSVRVALPEQAMLVFQEQIEGNARWS